MIDTHGRLLRYFGDDSNIIVPNGTTFIATGAFHGKQQKIVINKYVVSSPYYYNWKDDVMPAATINLVAA